VNEALHGTFTFSTRPLDTVPDMKDSSDEPLPATLTFVFTLGGLIAIGWFAMYALMRARW
jgi:hypothetical protein